MRDKYDDAQRRKSIAPIVILALFLWCANFYFAIYFPWGETDNTNRGTFGDVFGVVNSIFSGFAFIGVAWSISMQRDELRITREDRDDTRKILEAQQTNLEQQNESNKIARFETTFFQLFQSFRDMIADFYLDAFTANFTDHHGDQQLVTIKESSGHAVFKGYCGIVTLYYHRHRNQDTNLAKADSLYFAFVKLHHTHGDDVGRYFRTLYTLMDFIDSSDLNDDQKRFYTKLVRAQLSQEESTFLAYNSQSQFTTTAFNELIGKYGMLKNADHNDSLMTILKDSIPHKYFGRTWESIIASNEA
ncbi:putative phage abortive infection protein [Paracoccus sp. (in: a-proteobacteria)]|uniref:putative phage abortive infection protein n=1 Tax=Paracoccus sp. TaxID=267 RepID=UPI0040595F86